MVTRAEEHLSLIYHARRPYSPLDRGITMDIKDTMFVAGKHDVAWSDLGHGWMLENEEVGIIRTYPNLIRALSELERVSGIGVNDFAVERNPYGRA